MNDGTDTLTYTYNQFNQLKTVTKNGSAFATYTYDNRGNQIKESQVYMTVGDTKYNQVTDYTYDLRNQMTQAKITTPDYVNNAVVNNEVIQTNAYNASGQRIRKVEDGATTNYYYMGSALLLSANANNWLMKENILDPSGTIVASARFDDTNPGVAEGFYFYHYDMRGSTTAIVGANGNLQKGYTYDVFGSIEESGNVSFLNEVTFTYDNRGNQIKETQVYMTVGDEKYNQVTDYTYDLQNQMTQAKIQTPDYVNNQVIQKRIHIVCDIAK